MSQLSQYQKFKLATWEYLKIRGYKPNGQVNFVYTGKEFKTVVHIQQGKDRESDYGFYNISYARLDNADASLYKSDFFHFRQDSFGPNGFISMGSGNGSPYPVDVSYSTDKKIVSAIKMLQVIEPIFRVETKEDLILLYPERKFIDSKLWSEQIKRLTDNEIIGKIPQPKPTV